VLLILSSNSFSQTVTDKICFSYDKAQSIAIDLTRGDSALAELKVVNKMVWQLNEKIDIKDSTINIYIAKEKNYLEQVATYNQVTAIQDGIIKGLEQDVTDLTRKNSNLKTAVILMGSSLGTLVSILILSLSK
jgi:hypothetical protein